MPAGSASDARRKLIPLGPSGGSHRLRSLARGPTCSPTADSLALGQGQLGGNVIRLASGERKRKFSARRKSVSAKWLRDASIEAFGAMARLVIAHADMHALIPITPRFLHRPRPRSINPFRANHAPCRGQLRRQKRSARPATKATNSGERQSWSESCVAMG